MECLVYFIYLSKPNENEINTTDTHILQNKKLQSKNQVIINTMSNNINTYV